MTTVIIPDDKGVEYQIDGEAVTGTVEAEGVVSVKAVPKSGYRFTEGCETEWVFEPLDDVDSFE